MDMAYSGCEIMQGTKMSDAKPLAELCSLEIDGAIARLTLRRSDVFNALNVQLISEMVEALSWTCLLYTSPSPRDGLLSRMPSSA